MAMAVEPVDHPGVPERGREETAEVARRLLARTVSSCFRYRVTGLAAEAAFFAILSLPPLVFGLAGTIGYIARQFQVSQVDVLRNRVIDLASQALTPDTVDKVIAPTMNSVLRGGRLDVISIGFVLALWSGSRALNVFIDTISIMYGYGGHRGIVKTRALSFTLYVVALLIGIVLVPLVLAGPDVVADVIPDRVAFLRGGYWPSVLVLSVGFMTSLYHLSVPAKKTWRSGVPGATFTLAMWILGSYFVRWALGLSAGGTSIYGPLAAPIAVLLWLYVLSISVLIGAAINAAIDVERHPRDETPEGGVLGSA
jgi:membrane protein